MSVEAHVAGQYIKSTVEQRKFDNEISAAQIWALLEGKISECGNILAPEVVLKSRAI